MTVWRFDTTDGAGTAADILADLERDGVVVIQDAATVEWEVGKRKPKTFRLRIFHDRESTYNHREIPAAVHTHAALTAAPPSEKSALAYRLRSMSGMVRAQWQVDKFVIPEMTLKIQNVIRWQEP